MDGNAMTAPWTPRERALREALELYRQHDEISNDWIAWVGPQAEETRLKAKELWFAFRREARAALADPPTPDPRDAALEMAEQCLNEICETYSTDTLDELWGKAEAALTAIRAAKGWA